MHFKKSQDGQLAASVDATDDGNVLKRNGCQTVDRKPSVQVVFGNLLSVPDLTSATVMTAEQSGVYHHAMIIDICCSEAEDNVHDKQEIHNALKSCQRFQLLNFEP